MRALARLASLVYEFSTRVGGFYLDAKKFFFGGCHQVSTGDDKIGQLALFNASFDFLFESRLRAFSG